jgi:hypothetical protein
MRVKANRQFEIAVGYCDKIAKTMERAQILELLNKKVINYH